LLGESVIQTCEGGLTLVFWMYRNLMRPKVSIQVAEGVVSQPLQHFINEG
jgi:hypothetical protein